MTPAEVLEGMKKAGVLLSRPSLTRYEAQQLIPHPERGGGGRGVGMWTSYPDHTVAEAVAAWRFLNGDWGNEETRALFAGKPPRIPPEAIAAARFQALDEENDERIERDPAAWTTDEDFRPKYQLIKKIRELEIKSEEAQRLIWALAASWKHERDQARKL